MEKPKVGDVVEFLGKNAVEFHLEQSKKVLEIGKRYVVSDIFADMWGIYIYVEGVPRKSFRSEMFALMKRVDDSKGDEKSGKRKRKTTKTD
jgi:hypothetical protein